MQKIEILVLSTIVVLAFLVRLYKVDRPVADWHSWRQADTAAVSRNFIKEGFNPFIPKYDDMSAQASGLDNPNRYRFVEFPVYNLLVALVWLFTGVNETVARLTTVFITLGSTLLLYFLVKTLSGFKTAALSSFFFATVPYNVFYSSAILPAPLMIFFILALFVSFYKFLENEKKYFYLILSIIFASLAVLTWPIAIFFTLPLIYLAFNKYGLLMFKKISLWLLLLLSLLPFILWRIWMNQFPEGIPNWQFLINEGNIRFKGAFFRWLIAERLGGLILTVSGFTIFIIGILKKLEIKEGYFYHFWLLSLTIYFIVFASGNVRHDYYQIPAIPVLAIFLARGFLLLFNLPSKYFFKALGPVVAVLLILLTYAFGFFEVRGFYWINRPEIVEAGNAVDRLIPQNASVIAPYNGDAAFLYQTNRHGYPLVDRPLKKYVQEGTKYFVSVDINDSGILSLTKQCSVVDKTASYVILELSEKCITE